MQTHEVKNIISDLKLLGSPEKAKHLQRFFKTGPGHYGHGDVFWGITVPLMRSVARKYSHMSIDDLEILLEHDVHEVRLCALLIMVLKTKTDPEKIYKLYVKKIRFVNNWDLVDLSAPIIIGDFLIGKDCALLYKLAQSPSFWEQRIAIVATFAFIKQGHYDHTLKIAQLLMDSKQDLIHKAAGWMLREVGKRCSESILENFLEEHAATMPRTMLRYAIERLPDKKKKYFMGIRKKHPEK